MLSTLRFGAGLSLFCALSVFAQNTGRISGTVVDAQGGAIPGTTVNLLLRGGASPIAQTVTSSTGNFFFGGVQPVNFDIEFQASGFQKQILRNVKVDPGVELSVPVVKLEVSQAAEVVEVTANVVAVQTSNAEIAATVTNEQIRRLPTLNRSPLGLISLQAGVGGNGRTNTTINGLRPSFTNITIDGINIQDNFIRTNTLDFSPNMLQLDQIAEFTIATSNTNAGQGNGAAQVSFVTPSGSNEYHGSLIWNNRNNAFASNTWFNNRNGVRQPFLNQNQFGGSFGGKIVKDKLFFYGNYEATRQRQQSSQTRTILRAAAREGIFTYRDAVSGEVRTANVLTAAGTTADATMRTILGQIPGADKINRDDIGDNLNTGGYSFNIRNNRTRDNITGKIDYVMSSRSSITGSYIWNRDILDRPDLANDYTLVPKVSNDNSVPLMSTTWRFNPTATFTNEARFGFNLAPAVFATNETFGDRIFSLPLVSNPLNTFRAQGREVNTYNLQNNSSWFKGAHTFQFGFQGQILHAAPYNDAGNIAQYNLGISGANTFGLNNQRLPGVRAQDVGIANNLLALHAGFITSSSQTFNVTSRSSGFVGGSTNLREMRQRNWALYLNDTWKMNRKLTLTLGARWEYYSPVDEVQGLFLMPVVQGNSYINTLMSNATLDFAGSAVGRPYYARDLNNIGPNIGLAWQPFGDGKTVIRAGYSINFPPDEFLQTIRNNLNTNDGLSQGVSVTNLVNRASAPPPIPTPTFRVPRTFADNFALNPSAAYGMPDPNLRTPYVQQWNFSIQREVASGVLEVRYVGNRSVKQFRGFDYNQVVVKENGFLPDFLIAQRNGDLAQAATGRYNPAFDPSIAGSQRLPFFDRMPAGGTLSNVNISNLIQQGQVGELANFYTTSRLNGSVNFFNNPYGLGVNAISNYSNANYNAAQIDYRRTVGAVQLQANYTYSKVLSDSAGDGQTRFEPFLDINNASIERSRTPFDLTHSFKVNGNWSLPFGAGRLVDLKNPVLDRVFGGWSVSGFMTLNSGAPFSILSNRGTLNRAARSSGLNTANTTLTGEELDSIVTFRQTGNGPFFIAATAIGPDGRGTAADGRPAFSGQAFSNPGAGTLGVLQRRRFTGPRFWNTDFAILKQVSVHEKHRFEIRAEFFNLTNTPSFFIGDQDINNANFGRITSTASGRRIVQFGLQYRF